MSQHDTLTQALEQIAIAAEATVCNPAWIAQHARAALATPAKAKKPNFVEDHDPFAELLNVQRLAQVQQSETAPSVDQLPGMWDTSDLIGGETDCVHIKSAQGAGEVSDKSIAALWRYFADTNSVIRIDQDRFANLVRAIAKALPLYTTSPAHAQPVQGVPQDKSDAAQILAAELRGNVAEKDYRAWARQVLPLLDWLAFSTIASPPPAQQPESVPSGLHEKDIYDFAGWLTSRPGVMEVGCTSWACPMADAVVEYIKTFPQRFAPAQQPSFSGFAQVVGSTEQLQWPEQPTQQGEPT